MKKFINNKEHNQGGLDDPYEKYHLTTSEKEYGINNLLSKEMAKKVTVNEDLTNGKIQEKGNPNIIGNVCNLPIHNGTSWKKMSGTISW